MDGFGNGRCILGGGMNGLVEVAAAVRKMDAWRTASVLDFKPLFGFLCYRNTVLEMNWRVPSEPSGTKQSNNSCGDISSSGQLRLSSI